MYYITDLIIIKLLQIGKSRPCLYFAKADIPTP